GAITVNGNLTIGTGTALDVTASNFALTVKKNWSNNGTFTARSGTVTLSGTVAQILSGATTFNNLTLNNTVGLTLSSSVTVNATLTMTNGKITTGVNILALGTGGAFSGASNTKYIVGNLQKAFNTGSGQSFTFHIGPSTRYTPVALTALDVTTPGNVTAST